MVALCYWQGLTQEQAAVQLGCPLGTVRSRLARARDLLRRRLTRRGLATLAAGVAAALGGESATASIATVAWRLAPIPTQLIQSTIRAAAQVAAGQATAQVASGLAASLVQTCSLEHDHDQDLQNDCRVRCRQPRRGWGESLGTTAQRATPSTASRASVGKGGAGESQGPRAEKIRAGLRCRASRSLLVEVLEALPGRPISGERLVRPDGNITLGFYGDVHVAGLTLPEVKEKIIHHLQKYLTDELSGSSRSTQTRASRRSIPRPSNR